MCATVIKEFRRTRKNSLRRNGEFFSTQKLPEVKCTVVAVPLNRRNCQSLEGKESSKDDEESIRAGQKRAGGYRESEEPKGNRELNDSLGNTTPSNQHASDYFNAHHWVNCAVLYGTVSALHY